MARRVSLVIVGTAVVLAVLAGCSHVLRGGETRAAWRNAEEKACMVRHHVDTGRHIEKAGKKRDRGACGIDRALKVSALADGRTVIGPSATLNCPMTAALEIWIQRSVQPAAMAWYGQPVVEVKQMASYACRTRNNDRGARLSEHSFGNALDIGGFVLADGTTLTVKRDWNGDVNARSFLREVFAGACETFKTALGPGVRNHSDHFHLDLAHHNDAGTSRYCRPTPTSKPPRRAPYWPRLLSDRPRIDPVVTGMVASADGSIPATPVRMYAPVPSWPPQ